MQEYLRDVKLPFDASRIIHNSAVDIEYTSSLSRTLEGFSDKGLTHSLINEVISRF